MPNKTELLDILFSNRGIKKEDQDFFLNPSYERDFGNPFSLKDMEMATVRIFEAITSNQKIVIYSDYDADGIPAAVIMKDFFDLVDYKNYFVYIPHRHEEGYGLHSLAIDDFVKQKVDLILTFDLGITAIEEIEKAKIENIDTIVFDHHLPKTDERTGKDILPCAFAVVDPKRQDCNYKDKFLCGAGIAFKLIQALFEKYKDFWNLKDGHEKWFLDMAGVATISDQVPLLLENRAMAYFGLKVLKKTKRPGVVELFLKSGLHVSSVGEEDIAFTLAPRINVASRLADPMLAFELLSTKDPSKAKALASELDKINNDRKKIVANIMKEVKTILKKRLENEDFVNSKFVVIGNPKWHVGVLGLIASKILEEYKKTVFVWGGEDGEIRGSCRASGNVNLVSIMSSLPEGSLINFGGHKSAGGFSVLRDEIHFLEERISNVFSEYSPEEDPSVFVDASINIDDVTEDNYKTIQMLAPFGMANPRPIFELKNVQIIEIKEFGKEKNHLEITFENQRGKKIKAISFFKTREDFPRVNLEKDSKINLYVSLEKNNFGGREELRLRIIDILE